MQGMVFCIMKPSQKEEFIRYLINLFFLSGLNWVIKREESHDSIHSMYVFMEDKDELTMALAKRCIEIELRIMSMSNE